VTAPTICTRCGKPIELPHGLGRTGAELSAENRATGLCSLCRRLEARERLACQCGRNSADYPGRLNHHRRQGEEAGKRACPLADFVDLWRDR